MKTYTKPIAEVKEFGLSAAIADLGSYLAGDGKNLGLGGLDAKAIASYSYNTAS